MQLVLGGGIGTFETVRETLQMDIPVVIIEVYIVLKLNNQCNSVKTL